MDQNMQWYHETRGKKVVSALEKNGFTAAYFSDSAQAATHLLGLIADGAIIGLGGSETIKSLNIREKLRERGCKLLDHHQEGLSPEERLAVRRGQLTSDVFLCSSNAVTMQGELVNVDGTGNRVAAMMFGPKRVVIVVGINKLVNTLDEAQARIKTMVAPLNNRRVNYPNPCVETGTCMNCRNKTRICNLTTIIHRQPLASDIHVFVVGQELGY